MSISYDEAPHRTYRIAPRPKQLLDSLDIITPGKYKSELINIAIVHLVKTIKDKQDATGMKPKDILPEIIDDLGYMKYDVLLKTVTPKNSNTTTLDQFIEAHVNEEGAPKEEPEPQENPEGAPQDVQEEADTPVEVEEEPETPEEGN